MGRVMIISPHMDDEVLGSGVLMQHPFDINVINVFNRSYDWGDDTDDTEDFKDWKEALTYLGVPSNDRLHIGLKEGEPHEQSHYHVLRNIEPRIIGLNPNIVVIPHHDDMNQDHRWLSHVCKIALRADIRNRVQSLRMILMAHSPDGVQKEANWFVSADEGQMHGKVSAFARYRTEGRASPHPRSVENIYAQARVWGSMAGFNTPFAEAYTLWWGR